MEMTVKVLVVGNGMVGKSSLVSKFAKGVMSEKYKRTIGTGM